MEIMPAMFGGPHDATEVSVNLTVDGFRVIRAALRDNEIHARTEQRECEEMITRYHAGNTGEALVCQHDCRDAVIAAPRAAERAQRYAILAELVTGYLVDSGAE